MVRFNKLAFVSVAAAVLATVGQAQIIVYGVNLDGPSEVPPNNSPGIGTALVTTDMSLVTMRVQVEFSGLIGTTTASHIHAPTAVSHQGTAGVATQLPTFTGFPLGVTSGTYDHTFDMANVSSYNPSFVTANGGTALSAWAALTTAMADGKSYLNIHSTAFGGGEIRGFLDVVPEPASMVVLGVGLVAVLRRRKRSW